MNAPPDLNDPATDGTGQPFLEHIRELRHRLMLSFLSVLICAIVAYVYYNPLLAVLTYPFKQVKFQHQLVMQTFFDPFVLRLKISMVAGVILALPVIMYHLLRFIFPALKPSERRMLGVVLTAGVILALTSVYFTYFWIIPFSLNFLMSRDFVPPDITLMLNLGDNLYYLVLFLLCTAVVFQIPLVLEVLMYYNVVMRSTLLAYGRFIVVVLFVIAAVITPPEIVSQCFVAVPLVALFYLAILIAKIFHFGEE